MQNPPQDPILITGATGYLASFLIKLLLEKDFKVRGTVRSLASKSSYQFLYDLVPEKSHNLELAEADLTNKSSWESATKGVKYVFHVASPSAFGAPKTEEEFIKPAVAGTLDILEAALANGVKKVVITSSCATISWNSSSKVLTEEDWTDDQELKSNYAKSKVKAERAAWEFYEKNKGKIEMTVVNPGYVFGPVLNIKETSNVFLGMIMKGILPGVFDLVIPMVDVRDVAEVHLRAMFREGTDGKRYICVAEGASLENIVHWINREFGKDGIKIPEKKVDLEEIMMSEDRGVQIFWRVFGSSLRFDNQKSVKELGMEYLSTEKTIIDTGDSLIKFRIVKGN